MSNNDSEKKRLKIAKNQDKDIKMMEKIKSRLLKIYNSNKLFESIVQMLYNLIFHPIVSPVILLGFSQWIAYNTKTYGYLTFIFFFSTGLNVIFLIINGIVSHNKKDKHIDKNLYLNNLNRISNLNHSISKEYSNVNKIFSINNKSEIRIIKEHVGLQQTAFVLCKSIADLLKLHYRDKYGGYLANNFNPYVTVYQKFISSEGYNCKMLACSDEGSESQNNFIPIKESSEYYYSRIFSSRDEGVRLKLDKESVKKVFSIHEHNKKRQEKIEQYIGIPIKIESIGIWLLLQIDVDKRIMEGSKNEEIEKVKTLFNPYINLLRIAYNNEAFLDNMKKCEYN